MAELTGKAFSQQIKRQGAYRQQIFYDAQQRITEVRLFSCEFFEFDLLVLDPTFSATFWGPSFSATSTLQQLLDDQSALEPLFVVKRDETAPSGDDKLIFSCTEPGLPLQQPSVGSAAQVTVRKSGRPLELVEIIRVLSYSAFDEPVEVERQPIFHHRSEQDGGTP